jgi:hypothetical protein
MKRVFEIGKDVKVRKATQIHRLSLARRSQGLFGTIFFVCEGF